MFKPALAVTLAGLLLASCTNSDGTTNHTVNGAVIGGVSGAALGNAFGNKDNSALIGGVAGAVIGGAIGNQMDAQDRELRAAVAGTGATITNNGHTLVVGLPEAITFNTGSATVHSGLVASIQAVSRSLQAHPNSTVQVVGHTDNVGTMAYNQDLSERRALAVAQILVNSGERSSQITAYGRAFSEPVASNATAAGRAQNRRVEIIITPH